MRLLRPARATPARSSGAQRDERNARIAAATRRSPSVRPVDPPELVGIGVHVDQALPGSGTVELACSPRRDVAEPVADDEEDVRLPHAAARAGDRRRARGARRRRRRCCRHSPGSASRVATGSRLASHHAVSATVRVGAPGRTADDHERPLAPASSARIAAQIASAEPACARDSVRRRVRDVDLVDEHVLGQREHDRSRPPGRRRRGTRARRARGSGRRRRSAATHLAIGPNICR